ncbi:hypothetical protein B0H13DRAFT_2288079 [Mycena leptocephala]|nr:hypothetical protein B0H13DRAFT_2288079 [Mycena leptocephala]
MSVRIVLLLTMRENCFAAWCSLASNFWILGALSACAALRQNPSTIRRGNLESAAARRPRWGTRTWVGTKAADEGFRAQFLGVHTCLSRTGTKDLGGCTRGSWDAGAVRTVLTSSCDGSPPMSARSVRKCCAGFVMFKHLVALAMWEEEKEGARLPSHHWPCVRSATTSRRITPDSNQRLLLSKRMRIEADGINFTSTLILSRYWVQSSGPTSTVPPCTIRCLPSTAYSSDPPLVSSPPEGSLLSPEDESSLELDSAAGSGSGSGAGSGAGAGSALASEVRRVEST